MNSSSRALLVAALLAACTNAKPPPADVPDDTPTGTTGTRVTPVPVDAVTGPGTDVPLDPLDPGHEPDPRELPPPVGVDGWLSDEAHAGLTPPDAPPPEPEPELPPEPGTRRRHRVDIDQVDDAIAQVTGFHWTERRAGVDVNLWEELAATLGKPDYVASTAEDLDPSGTFMKFLDDAARETCTAAMQADAAGTPPLRLLLAAGASDTWETAPAAVDANLVRLLLRFHGRRVAPGSPELEPWRMLFRSGHRIGGAPLEGWRAVCVALVTHEDFFSY